MGLKWGFGDGQAGPCMGLCMGRCMGGAWVHGGGDVLGVFIKFLWSHLGPCSYTLN